MSEDETHAERVWRFREALGDDIEPDSFESPLVLDKDGIAVTSTEVTTEGVSTYRATFLPPVNDEEDSDD